MARLSHEQISYNISKIPGWKLSANHILREFVFDRYREAVAFVNQVAEYAEEMNHHPDISLCHIKVSISLTTHDEGGLTGKDFALAQRINKLRPHKGKVI